MTQDKWTTENIPDQKGKIIVVTGANCGLGFDLAKVLSKKNATVIMAVRDASKGARALQEIKKELSGAITELMLLDLADLKSIENFATEFKKRYSQLNILINNAGVMYPPGRQETKQGFELQIGTNHLGHFALTGLLLDIIKKTKQARIVTQSSLAHLNGSIRLNDLNWHLEYSRTKAYGQSKLANLLFAYELDRKFKAHLNTAVSVASHPGISNTSLQRTSGFLTHLLFNLMAQTSEMGALPELRAATDEKLTGGEYIGPNGLLGVRGYPEIVRSNKQSYDLGLAQDLWTLSEKLTGVHFNF